MTLIRSALRRCLGRLEVLDAEAAATLRAGLRRHDYDASAKPQIVWDDPQARRELLAELFADTTATLAVCAGVTDADLEAAAALLARVAAQDLEVDNGGDGDEPQVHGARGSRPFHAPILHKTWGKPTSQRRLVGAMAFGSGVAKHRQVAPWLNVSWGSNLR